MDSYWIVTVDRASGVSQTLGPYPDSDEAHGHADRIADRYTFAAVVGRR